MIDSLSYDDALAALAWQVELGADEALLDHPVDRFDLPAPVATTTGAAAAPAPAMARPPLTSATPVQHATPDADGIAIARQVAEAAGSIATLHAALAGFEHCELKRGARGLVFADGHPSARVMVVGEVPGRDEDEAGKPFVGAPGQMLDAMFAAIGLDRRAEGENGLYLTDVLPWRPPQDRLPRPEELAIMAPFLRRHIALAEPDVLILMGNHPCAALLDRRGIARMRGTWEVVLGVPALPMLHPGDLLKTPIAKREAWADLLVVKARLEGPGWRGGDD